MAPAIRLIRAPGGGGGGGGGGGSPLTVSFDPTNSAFGGGFTPPNTFVTGTVTALPNGGQSPYTYSWTFVSGDSSVSIIQPSNAQAQQWVGTVTSGGLKIANWRCTVTDALSATAFGDVQVTIQSFD